MKYYFDRIIERKGTGALKTDVLKERYGREDLTALWVTDMDSDNLESVCDDKCRMLILSNPHNPAGIVWPRETLERLASFCHKRGIIVISDEIHCDMALYGHKHIPFASVSPEAASFSITFGAPSKTFNPGGQGFMRLNVAVPRSVLRDAMQRLHAAFLL